MSSVIQFRYADDSRVLFSETDEGNLLMEEVVPKTDGCQPNTVRTALPFTPEQVAELRDWLQAVFP